MTTPDAQENPFGSAFRSLRESAGLSLREVAEQSGLHFTYVSKVERGDFNPPSADTIVTLARIVGADADTLLVLAGKAPPDLVHLLSTDVNAVKKARKALKL